MAVWPLDVDWRPYGGSIDIGLDHLGSRVIFPNQSILTYGSRQASNHADDSNESGNQA